MTVIQREHFWKYKNL